MRNHKIISIIPARGGSKRIPRKNIKSLAGKPLVAYTIEASLKSKLVDRTIVSTDDKKIAEISRKWGAEVPFLRPPSLAKDSSLDYPLIKHCLDYLIKEEDYKPEILLYLRPTSPLRTSKEISTVIRLLIDRKDVDCVRTVHPVRWPPYWMKTIDKNGLIQIFDDSIAPFVGKLRQDLPEAVLCDGYVDAAYVSSIIKYNVFPPGKKLAYYRKLSPHIDMDTKDDWDFGEFYINKNKGKKLDTNK